MVISETDSLKCSKRENQQPTSFFIVYMQSQLLVSQESSRIQTITRGTTVVMDGANSCGKTARGEVMSELTGFGLFDTGAKLREMKEKNLLPEDVVRCMSECGYVPDPFICRLLRNYAYYEPAKSKIYVGVRTVTQLHDLFLNAYNFEHRIIHVRLHRKKVECMKLAELRGREDANPEAFDIRWGLYQEHATSIQSFLNSRPAIRQISYRLTDNIHEDSAAILRLIQPHCPNITMPDLLMTQ